ALGRHHRRHHPLPRRQARPPRRLSRFGATRPHATTQAQRGLEPASSLAGRGRPSNDAPARGIPNPGSPRSSPTSVGTVQPMLLRRRLLLLFVAVVVGVLVLGTLTVVLLRERDDAQQRERELSVATERVAQLGTAYADQETGERGFVIAGEAAFLEPYD